MIFTIPNADIMINVASSSPRPGQSLKDIRPDLAEEWHPTLNSVSPSDVSLGSAKSVWWQCPVATDHAWEAKVQSRSKQGQGCPFCAGRRASAERNLLKWCELNGEFGALLISQFCTDLNLVTMDKLTQGSQTLVWWKCAGCRNTFDSPVSTRTSARTNCPYCSGHRVSKDNSLAVIRPEIAMQWDVDKNDSLTPSDVTSGSGKKVWWRCQIAEDHRWEASISARTGPSENGCPYCRGLRASTTNSLATLRPDIAAEWDTSKNGVISPASITCGSGKKFWWRCSRNAQHSWQMPVVNRAISNQGCPFCAGKRVDNSNSFNSKFPELVSLFDSEKNACDTNSILSSSQRKYWWSCPNGPDHNWRATPLAVSQNNQPCPCCPPRITQLSVSNSLFAWCSQNGERGGQILAEWDVEANHGLSPQDLVYPKQKLKVHWQCQKANDHRWTSDVYERTVDGTDCPFCIGRRPSSTNNLALKFPGLTSHLHKTLNGSIDPSQLSPTTHEVLWWQCPVAEDHVWEASVNQMKGSLRCGFCAGKKVSASNSLTSRFPEIADEFDLEKNYPLTPNDVTYGSSKKHWWRCPTNPEHMWQATVTSRTGMLNTGCPECVVVPRSRREIILSHEIGSFFQIDQFDHRIRANGKSLDCDIILRDEKLVIEYDGSYWHKEKSDLDQAKTKSLIEAGWKVVRVREEPLPLIQPHDVLCSEYEPIVGVAARVLRTITHLIGRPISDLDEYESKLQARAIDEAENFIQDLLKFPDAVTAYRKRQSWERRFHELEEFADNNGTADPSTIPGAPKKLITWVHKQRDQYLSQALSSEFSLRLESLPDWHWSQVDFRWRKQYETLLTAYESGMQMGPSSIGQTLSSWVVHQRKLFGLNQLNEEQISLLNELPDWSWAPMQDAWHNIYEVLLKYVKRTGTSEVPQDHVEDEVSLGVWVNKQRGRHRRGVLETDRQTLLDSLPGWTWSPSDSRNESMFEAFSSFISREKHPNVPATHIEGEFKLGQWLTNARNRHRLGNIHPDLELRLSSIQGFDWDPLESRIPGNIDLLEDYLKTNPDIHSLRKVVHHGRKLNSIAVYLRQHFKKGILAKEYVERLEALPNWSWSPFDDFWRTGYSQLMKYVEREGTSLVPQTHLEGEFRLGTWVNSQRVTYRKGFLSKTYIVALEMLPGWTWQPQRGPRKVAR